MDTTLIAVDLAKDVFELACAHRAGRRVERHRLNPQQFHHFFAQCSPVNIVIEACGTAHYWARELGSLGHTVRLPPTRYVRAYRHRNKTDSNDGLTTRMRREHRTHDTTDRTDTASGR